MDKGFVISLSGLAAGKNRFFFTADTEFFHSFGNNEILDAHVGVEVTVQKSGSHKVEADLRLSGSLTVACDRCLEPLTLPVSVTQCLDAQEEELISEDGDLDLSQAVYDYACLALPLQRVHPDGACNPNTVRFLSHEEREDEEAASSSPFAALKGLFEE
ncbi:MAG: DUF177 domain-containing protein [Bacteroidales bacterium]|nr:DUF177 domain-containing protein [Bacteroidales bacterium]